MSSESLNALLSELLYFINLAVDVPLLFWALSLLVRRPRLSDTGFVLALIGGTGAYVALKAALRFMALFELPLVSLLLVALILAVFNVRGLNALFFAVVYSAFTSIIVSTTYKMMDFTFGYDLIWAYVISVSCATGGKVLFAWYCRSRVEGFMAMSVRWPQALLMVFLWPVTVSLLAFNRDVIGPYAAFFAQPSVLVVMLCLLAIVTILWVIEFAGYSETQRMMERLNWALTSQRQVYEQKLAHDEQMRRLYHDFKHIRTLVDEGKVADLGAHEMLDQMNATLRYHEMQPHTGNFAIDALITQKSLDAQQRGVELQTYMDLQTSDFIKDIDLVCIVANALDNAIEAAAHVSKTDHRFVQAKAGVVGSQLAITVTNWYEGALKKNARRYLTTKEDAFGHGYGLATIERIAHQYGGHLGISNGEGIFELCVTVPLPSPGQKPPKR